ncbi:MAG: type I restriction enzyme HsdR N-terminal domain-containing protein [Desulfosarcinaceae bacterium]|nr:type I restriction enzyme HsdR N-terminal domain-containing protein [Desulfosarcinaceae bacterium]
MTAGSHGDTLIDYLSGSTISAAGAEENRQALLKYLVAEKGYAKTDLATDVPIRVTVAGETYASTVDVVVQVAGEAVLVIKCAAGSLGSREREAISAARLLAPTPLPLAAVSDGRTATLLDTRTGKPMGSGLAALPDPAAASRYLTDHPALPLDAVRRERESLIFRSYDGMNVHRLGGA